MNLNILLLEKMNQMRSAEYQRGKSIKCLSESFSMRMVIFRVVVISFSTIYEIKSKQSLNTRELRYSTQPVMSNFHWYLKIKGSHFLLNNIYMHIDSKIVLWKKRILLERRKLVKSSIHCFIIIIGFNIILLTR